MHESERDQTVRLIARDGDPDRALAALFAPRGGRAGLLALIAFNVELARIAEQVSEPGLGAIRLQWWREAVARAASGETTGHPVADALGAAIRRHELSRDRLAAMIDARSFDIATKVMPDQPALETYLQDTAGALFALSAACLGARGPAVELAAAQAGLAYGLTGLMRSLPMHAALGRVDLPADALRRHGTSPDDVLAGKSGEDLAAMLGQCRSAAAAALREAQSHVRALDAEARAAFLPLALVEPYLAELGRERDPLRKVAAIGPLYRLWRLTRWRA
ncbi:MAG: squalene/phytoene synthase family protein [Methyloceanibacter sp.]